MIKTKNPLALYCILLTTIFNSNIAVSASNEPVLLNDVNNSGIEDFRFAFDAPYLVFNQYILDDDLGRLDRFSSNVNSPRIVNQLRSNLSPSNEFFVFDRDDARIISTNGNNGSLVNSSLNGQSSIEIFAPTGEDAFRISGLIDNTNLQVFSTTSSLFSTDSMGAQPPVNLSLNLSPSDTIDRFRVTRDRLNVIFSANIELEGLQKIFSVPIDGSSAPTLLHTLPFASDVDGTIFVSPDSTRIVYIVETFLENNIETLTLYSTPVDGSSPPIALGTPIDGSFQAVDLSSVTGSNVDIDFEFSDDGQFIVYTLQNFPLSLLNETIQTSDAVGDLLFSVPTTGGLPTLIDAGSLIRDADISNDSQTIVFTRVPFFDEFGFVNVLSSNIDGSQLTSLFIDNNLSGNSDVDIGDIRITSDSKYVFFASQNGGLFKADIKGNTPAVDILSGRFDFVNLFRFSEGSSNIVFSGRQEQSSINQQVYSINFDGTELNTISTSENGNVFDIELSQDGQFVAFITSEFGGSRNRPTPSPDLLYLANTRPTVEDETCFPIKTKTDDITIICF